MPPEDRSAGFAHLIRAAIAIILTLALPALLYMHLHTDPDVLRVYLDALAAVVAFYFGASSNAS